MSMSDYGKGYSPRKSMAGTGDSGNFGVEKVPGSNGTPHPDVRMGTGMKGPMSDSERGAGPGVMHNSDMHPAQASPRHGPQHEKTLGFNRSSKA